MSTRMRQEKERVLTKFKASGPVKPERDQSNKTYETARRGEKPYVIQPPTGGTVNR